MRLLALMKCTYCCCFRAGILWWAWCKKQIFLIVFRACKQYSDISLLVKGRVVDSWKIQGLTSCLPDSELQVGAKIKYRRSRDLLGCCVKLLIIIIPSEKLSWYWFLGKMGHISMNQLCYFIPAPFVSCSSSFSLGPKAELAPLTVLVKK